MIPLIWHRNWIFWPFLRILWYKNDENRLIISWKIEKIKFSVLYSNAHKMVKSVSFSKIQKFYLVINFFHTSMRNNRVSTPKLIFMFNFFMVGLGLVCNARKTAKNAYFSKIRKLYMVSDFFHTFLWNNRVSTSKLIFRLIFALW